MSSHLKINSQSIYIYRRLEQGSSIYTTHEDEVSLYLELVLLNKWVFG